VALRNTIIEQMI